MVPVRGRSVFLHADVGEHMFSDVCLFQLILEVWKAERRNEVANKERSEIEIRG